MSRDGYDRDRDSFDNNARGRIWENGTDRHYRDRENGYLKPSHEQELHIEVGANRRYDKQRGAVENGPVRAIEDKSGEISGRKDESQLERDYELIKDGKVEHLLLRSVAGERISPKAQGLIAKLQRDFPDKFTHQIVPRADAREVWALGRQLERGQQLELPGIGQQAREQVRDRKDPGQVKAFTKALETGKSLADQRERHREQVHQQLREIADRAEAGKSLAAETLQKQHERLSKRLDSIREAERRNERHLLQSLGLRLSEDRMRTVEQMREEERERRRQDVVRGLEKIGREVEQGYWREIAVEHNARVQQLGIEHVRAVEQRFHGREGLEREIAVEQARRQADRLQITPEKVAGLDLERFRAVRDGQDTGYHFPDKTHTYQRSAMPAVEVEHDAPERRLARMVRDVDRGLSVDQVLMREVLDISSPEPATEAARQTSIHRPPMSQGRYREAERHRERGIDRGPDRVR
ncbi:hypothetical protein [Nocardia higoensis]|uniref:hypothetical protein n=1 Tax=Nocardia higoensis TaxID=228599 RepID=UPI0003143615|nr:hypothetical protein [Nocardia higoensis]